MKHQESSVHVADKALGDVCARLRNYPYEWVMWAFDWGEGQLEGFESPDKWQTELLQEWGRQIRDDPFNGVDAVAPKQFAVTSGHGVGKSALSSWLGLFVMSTRPMSKGVYTANTGEQLKTKTWAEMAKWKDLCITGHWFEYHNSRGNMVLLHPESPNNWRIDALTSREENSESFAGLHASNSSPWYLFDEASAVPDKIWEVAEGGKTDGEPFHFVFGNPTRGTGSFFKCFGSNKEFWTTIKVDSRESKITNKKLISTWEEQWGVDSDFFRVRVRGLFPNASNAQLISTSEIEKASTRNIIDIKGFELIAGVDVARGGDDNCVLQYRAGKDARTYRGMIIPGKVMSDSVRFADILCQSFDLMKPKVINVDATGIGGPLADILRSRGYNAIDINFGSNAIYSAKFSNRAAEMWHEMSIWIANGGCIKDREELLTQLGSREYGHDNKTRLLLESKDMMKKRGVSSPDEADALALTFATKVKTMNTEEIHGKINENNKHIIYSALG